MFSEFSANEVQMKEVQDQLEAETYFSVGISIHRDGVFSCVGTIQAWIILKFFSLFADVILGFLCQSTNGSSLEGVPC
jgi:hypothetical protein